MARQIEIVVPVHNEQAVLDEVPVDWVDDHDSRVDIVSTAIGDLRGTARLLASSRPARFAGVGVLSTAAYALLFLALRGPLGPGLANALALALTAVGNTAINRRFTFGVKGRDDRVRQHAMGFAIYLLTVALTSGALAVLHDVVLHPARGLELAVLIAASSVATITRYLALRSWVFRTTGPRRFDAGSMVKVGL